MRTKRRLFCSADAQKLSFDRAKRPLLFLDRHHWQREAMSAETELDVTEILSNPNPEDAPRILEALGLAGLPTREDVDQEIERSLLLPPTQLPDHWLPTYQA